MYKFIIYEKNNHKLFIGLRERWIQKKTLEIIFLSFYIQTGKNNVELFRGF